jgi:hypothetical protein
LIVSESNVNDHARRSLGSANRSIMWIENNEKRSPGIIAEGDKHTARPRE